MSYPTCSCYPLSEENFMVRTDGDLIFCWKSLVHNIQPAKNTKKNEGGLPQLVRDLDSKTSEYQSASKLARLQICGGRACARTKRKNAGSAQAGPGLIPSEAEPAGSKLRFLQCATAQPCTALDSTGQHRTAALSISPSAPVGPCPSMHCGYGPSHGADTCKRCKRTQRTWHRWEAATCAV